MVRVTGGISTLDRGSGKVSEEETLKLLVKGKQETAARRGARRGGNPREGKGEWLPSSGGRGAVLAHCVRSRTWGLMRGRFRCVWILGEFLENLHVK